MLETPRLRLRSWRMSDAAAYARACNTPLVMLWLGGVQSRRSVKREVGYFAMMEARDGFTFWVIERRADNKLLGFCGLLRITERDCPFSGLVEIGWRVSASQWRKGYAFEAANRVARYGFDELGLAMIVSRVASGNVASRALMKKLGMKRRRDLDYLPKHENAPLLIYSLDSSGAWLSGARFPQS